MANILEPYTVTLLRANLAANVDSSPIVPPDGYIYVVTDVSTWLNNPTAGSAVQLLRTSDSCLILQLQPGTANWYSHWSGRQRIDPGEDCHVHMAGVAGAVSICGYQLAMS